MKIRTIVKYSTIGLAVGSVFYVAGCVRFSGGTWMVKEAPLPEGWPELTPVGEVQVREYPEYRAAIVKEEDVSPTQRDMFMTLFDHIKRNDIAMTTPVEMNYSRGDDEPRMTAMAFIYRQPQWGAAGSDGQVEVRNMGTQLMASIGVRGNYNDQRMQENLALLDAWLAERTDEYRVIGAPRYLGYNGPFTLPFMRYGEVQVPVEQQAVPDSTTQENPDGS